MCSEWMKWLSAYVLNWWNDRVHAYWMDEMTECMHTEWMNWQECVRTDWMIRAGCTDRVHAYSAVVLTVHAYGVCTVCMYWQNACVLSVWLLPGLMCPYYCCDDCTWLNNFVISSCTIRKPGEYLIWTRCIWWVMFRWKIRTRLMFHPNMTNQIHLVYIRYESCFFLYHPYFL